MNNRFSTPVSNNCFEVKESRNKFLFLGAGALVVALALLLVTPRLLSVITLAGTILALVGGIMTYKAFHLKTILRIDSNGVFTSGRGLIGWSDIEECSAETLSRNALFTILCRAPQEPLLIDLSMSNLKNTADLKRAMAFYSGNSKLGEE